MQEDKKKRERELAKQAEENGERPKRQRVRLDLNAPVTNAEVLKSSSALEKAGVDETTAEVEKMREKLQEQYDKNKKRPFRFVEWVTSKSSFSTTVENVFHAMFLVKEGSVKITTDDGVAKVEPCETVALHDSNDEDDAEQRAANNTQAILSIDYDKWKRWCELV